MKRFVKGALLFTGGVAGGFVLCGITTIKLAIKSDTFRTAAINKFSDEVTTLLYGESRRSKISRKPYKASYRGYYNS